MRRRSACRKRRVRRIAGRVIGVPQEPHYAGYRVLPTGRLLKDCRYVRGIAEILPPLKKPFHTATNNIRWIHHDRLTTISSAPLSPGSNTREHGLAVFRQGHEAATLRKGHSWMPLFFPPLRALEDSSLSRLHSYSTYILFGQSTQDNGARQRSKLTLTTWISSTTPQSGPKEAWPAWWS